MRTSTVERNTNETKIKLTLNIDGSGESKIKSGIGFLDHMLNLFAAHGSFDLSVDCDGDTFVDDHHSVEDIGICLGMAIKECIADKKGIMRYGSMLLPMDEALVLCALDISGRSYLAYGLEIPSYRVGDFDTELCEEFWQAFVRESRITLHIRQLAGTNSHHIIEGAFKSVARSLSMAAAIDPAFAEDLPSTKGVI